MIINSLIISGLRHWAQQVDASASWDDDHRHESGTTQEWETRRHWAQGMHQQARALDYAADHFKAMWGNV